MICIWEKPSELDVYFETSCGHEVSTDGDDVKIKKCPFCKQKIIFLYEWIDSVIDKFI